MLFAERHLEEKLAGSLLLFFSPCFMQITMPPKTKRQIAASLNYRKQKDREETRVRVEAMVSMSGEARVGDESTSGEAGVEGQLTSSEARVWGELTSDEARVMDEQSTSEEDSTVKHPRLEDISTLAAEPLQEWLDNLPRDDLCHVALLLYTNFPRKFGLQKMDTAAAVAKFLQKTVRCWIDDCVENDRVFSDTQQDHYVRNNTLMSDKELCEKARVYVKANAAPQGRPNLTSSAFCQWVNNDLLPNSVLEPGYQLALQRVC